MIRGWGVKIKIMIIEFKCLITTSPDSFIHTKNRWRPEMMTSSISIHCSLGVTSRHILLPHVFGSCPFLRSLFLGLCPLPKTPLFMCRSTLPPVYFQSAPPPRGLIDPLLTCCQSHKQHAHCTSLLIICKPYF